MAKNVHVPPQHLIKKLAVSYAESCNNFCVRAVQTMILQFYHVMWLKSDTVEKVHMARTPAAELMIFP